MKDSPILKSGKNCWRIEHAARIAFLMEGTDYFHAFRETVKKAQHSVLIIGWNMDNQVEPPSEQESDALPIRMGDFLLSLLKCNSQPHIHVLDWAPPIIFGTTRKRTLDKDEWEAHPRLHVHLDDHHPTDTCHHQKIVVVDDRVALVGGLDLTRGRRDMAEQRPEHAHRRNVETETTPKPCHDTQMLVSSAVAIALGELARERWHLATSEQLSAPKLSTSKIQIDPHGFSYWPTYLAPDLEDAQVAIARTIPRYDKQAEAREAEQLLLDAIAAARDSIYIEAQYFTAQKIGAALAKRLQEYDGPEIVALLPEYADGWLSQNTMDALRERLFRQLQKADQHHRLRLYNSYVPGSHGQRLNMHSKTIIIDNELVRVGSANFSERAMGLDIECDLVLEANGDARLRSAISAFHNRLLGEHLGVEPVEIEARLSREGSLIRAIESLCGSRHTLKPLALHVTPEMDARVPDSRLEDPDQPIDEDELIKEFATAEEPHKRPHRNIAPIVSVLTAILATGRTAAEYPVGID